MIKFIHTADIHFGIENYGKIDQKTGVHTRLLDFNRALNYCIDVAIEQKVDFFLFSGDAYKTTSPSPTHQKFFMESFFRLYAANIPAIIVVGNHDNPLSFGKATSLDIFNNLPLDGFHVISKPKIIQLSTKNGPVNIVGIPWPTRNNIALSQKHCVKENTHLSEYLSEAVGNIVRQLAEQCDASIPTVLAGHLTVSSGLFSGSEKRAICGTDPLILPSQLAIAPFDYVALGHLHRHQNLNPHGYPAIVYSGSLERIDFGESKEEKGFCLVNIPEKGKATFEFIPTPTRRFIHIQTTLTEEEQTKQLVNVIKQHDITDAILKITYHVPPETKNLVNLQAVQQACSAALYVVSITPICKPIVRERRITLSVNMSLEHLLDAYLSQKPEHLGKKHTLIQKALSLSQESEES